MDRAKKLLRRILAFGWAIMRHGWALLAAMLGSFIVSIPSWVDPLLSPDHAAMLNQWLTISPHTYRYLAITVLGLGLLYASFLAWNEERDEIERLLTELNKGRAKDETSILRRIVNDTPRRMAEDRSARATEELARQMRLQHETEVHAWIKESGIASKAGQVRVDIAVEIVNSGVDTTLHAWGLTFATTDGYRYEVDADHCLAEKSPSLILTCLKERVSVNLAYFSEQIKRGQVVHGWLAAETPMPTTTADELQVYVTVFDHLDRQVEIIRSPITFQRKAS